MQSLAEFCRIWPTWHKFCHESILKFTKGTGSRKTIWCSNSNIPQSQCLPSRTACITPFPYEMPRGHLAGFVKIAACHYVAPSNYIKIHEVWVRLVRLEVYDKSIAIRLHFDHLWPPSFGRAFDANPRLHPHQVIGFGSQIFVFFRCSFCSKESVWTSIFGCR